MKKNIFVLSMAVLAACGSDNSKLAPPDKDVLMTSDIDGVAGWLSDPNALVKGEAHSGQYSLRVDQNHEFSPGYTVLLGQLSPTRIPGVKLDAWVFTVDRQADAKLVFVLKATDGKELLHEQIELDKVDELGKWVPVSREIRFPETANYDSQLVIYVWHPAATSPTYVDDLKLTALH